VHGRTDDLVTGYLTARKAHFQVLLTQYFGFVAFKVLVTASLLIVGAVLLINKQINIGQFVAAEIVIILVLNAVEKLLVKLDVVYDALTSVDKIGQLLDLPLNPESEAVERFSDAPANGGPRPAASVELRQLNYHYPDGARVALQGLNLRLEPGQHLGLAGPDGSGKTSLLRLLAGQLDGYTGVIAFNGTALRDIAPERLARMIADTLPGQELFSGSVLENLTLSQEYLHHPAFAIPFSIHGHYHRYFSRSTNPRATAIAAVGR
jgi:ABC-type bacteriocin/lantibiotic exporter with double-glycine peptidase domain